MKAMQGDLGLKGVSGPECLINNRVDEGEGAHIRIQLRGCEMVYAESK